MKAGDKVKFQDRETLKIMRGTIVKEYPNYYLIQFKYYRECFTIATFDVDYKILEVKPCGRK